MSTTSISLRQLICALAAKLENFDVRWILDRALAVPCSLPKGQLRSNQPERMRTGKENSVPRCGPPSAFGGPGYALDIVRHFGDFGEQRRNEILSKLSSRAEAAELRVAPQRAVECDEKENTRKNH